MSSKHTTILTAIQTAIRALDLTDISDANVVIAMLPTADKLIKAQLITLPAIIISPMGIEEINGQFKGNNVADDYGWPTTIAIVEKADSQDLIDDLDKYLTWRETLFETFHNQHLSGIVGDIVTQARPGSIMELNAWVENHLFVSGITLRTYTREVVR
jgi:hypothetical protein